MKKPKTKKVKRLDYHECADYISKKLGYNLRDTLGRWKGMVYQPDLEYRDFWHYLVEVCQISNGCEIYLPHPDDVKGWQKPILQAFWDEFGQGPYWVEW